MSSLATAHEARALEVRCTDDELIVRLTDGRKLSAPLAWFPRLSRATAQQRNSFELLGEGEGIHWPEVDEDISIAGLLAGIPSVEARRDKTARSA
ncbi:MAG: DUF2442 domain-containing protein [Alphaproteobacteria bacterium]|nr:MAG: DUF2442 domain-containing protein [Alphaproteobacteria bacterium]